MLRREAQRGAARGTLLATVALAALVAALLAWLADDTHDADAARLPPRADAEASGGDLLAGEADKAAVPRPLDAPVAEPTPPDPRDAWPEGMHEIVLTGRVVDARHEPWPGATVVFHPDRHTAGQLPPEQALDREDPFANLPHTLTGADGRFEIRGPWQSLRAGADWSAPLDPLVVISAEGMARQGHPAEGFRGESADLGDLVLRIPGASFRLRVVDEQGAPVAGATAMVRSFGFQAPADDDPQPPNGVARPPLGPSGPDGVLRTAHWWPGSPNLEVSAAGFRTATVSAELGLGDDLDLGDVVLVAGRRVGGRVVDAEGRGVPAAEVMVLSEGVVQTHAHQDPDFAHAAALIPRYAGNVERATTDAEGRFTIEGLDPERAAVPLLATAPGFRVRLAPAVPLETDDEVIVLERAGLRRVELRSALDDRPLADADLRARQLTGEDRHTPPIEVQDGTLHDLGPLGVELFAAAPCHLPKREELPPLEAGAERTVVLHLEPGEVAAGRIVDDLGAPVPDALVRLQTAAPTARLWDPEETRTDADGRFRFPRLHAATWSGTASKAGHLDATIDAFDSATRREPWELVLPRGARLHGVLLASDGTPAAGEWLRATHAEDQAQADEGRAARAGGEVAVLAGLQPQRPPRSWARSDQDGRYAFPGLRPGAWRLEAWPGVDLTLHLERGEVMERELRLAPPIALTGTARRGGAPAPHVSVWARREVEEGAEQPAAVSTRTDVEGRYRLQLGTPGPHHVSFRAAGGGRLQRNVEVPPHGAVLDVDFGSAVIAGRVVFDGGLAPPRNARVRLWREGSHVDSVVLDPSGSFRFEPLQAGSYKLIASGGVLLDTELGPFTLGAGERREDLVIAADLGAIVHGRLRDEAGEALIGLVHLRSETGSSGPPPFPVKPDSDGDPHDGEFWFEPVEPGAWRLELTALPEVITEESLDAAREPDPTLPVLWSRRLQLAPGDDSWLDLKLPLGVGR